MKNETINAAGQALNAKRSALYKAERTFETLESDWRTATYQSTGAYLYGRSRDIRKAWTPEVAAAFEAFSNLKAEVVADTAALKAAKLAATAERKASREAFRKTNGGTCQICEALILSKSGKIAHHGFTRPQYEGRQTPSCFGARELPFETSCDLLRVFVGNLKSMEAAMAAAQSKLAKNAPESFTVRDTYKRTEREVVKPEGWTKPALDEYRGDEFSRIYQDRLRKATRDLADIRADIKRQEVRLASWTPKALTALVVANS